MYAYSELRIITPAVTTLAVLSVGIAGKSATAMTVATPETISVATADTTLVHYNRGHHYGWYRGHHYGWYHHHHH
jgi:hypothetical protein